MLHVIQFEKASSIYENYNRWKNPTLNQTYSTPNAPASLHVLITPVYVDDILWLLCFTTGFASTLMS